PLSPVLRWVCADRRFWRNGFLIVCSALPLQLSLTFRVFLVGKKESVPEFWRTFERCRCGTRPNPLEIRIPYGCFRRRPCFCASQRGGRSLTCDWSHSPYQPDQGDRDDGGHMKSMVHRAFLIVRGQPTEHCSGTLITEFSG